MLSSMELSCQNYPVGDCLHQHSELLSDSDTMSLATEVQASDSTTDGSNPTSTKSVKNETTTKQEDKPQPTYDQIRIAQLINTKKEDPKLKEKLKRVMDATQRTMEEAYLALHDSEFDPNRAVNLLLEGDMETEWSTLSKKKKPKIPEEAKPAKNKTENVQEETQQCESWDTSLNAKPSIGNRGSNFRGRRGGRSFRGRGSSFDQPNYAERGRRFKRPDYTTGHNHGSENINIIQSRTFERVDPPPVKPVDRWDPKQPIASKLNQNRTYAWDEEEYTGSLSRSLVYTSSGSNQQTKLNDSPSQEAKLPIVYDDSMMKPTLPSIPPPMKEYDAPIRVKPKSNPPTSIPPPITTCCSSLPSALNIRPPPLGATPIRPRRVDKPKQIQEMTADNATSKPIGSITRFPSKPVEMPPFSAKNSAGLLDLQFGSLDLKDSPSNATNFSNSPSTSKLTENRTTNLNKTESASHTFSGSSNAGDSLPLVSLPLSNDNICEVPVSSQKLEQEPLACSSQYVSGTATTTTQSKSTSLHQNTYSASSGGMSAGTSNICPQYQCSDYVTQPSQSFPMVSSISNSYQNILGTESYTSGSQSLYASNPLPTSSYTTPYLTYSSTSQHKPTRVPPVLLSTSKDFEAGKGSSTRLAVPTVASMLPTNQSLSSTKPTNVPKTTGHSSMPPLIGHHHPMFMGQGGGIPYYQPPIYYQDMQLMQQQRLASSMNTAYYEMGYPSLTRDGVSYSMNDREISRQESTQPMPHGHQMIGASGHQSSSTVFRTETEHYLDPVQTSDNMSGMATMGSSSNDSTDMNFKSTNLTQKKK